MRVSYNVNAALFKVNYRKYLENPARCVWLYRARVRQHAETALIRVVVSKNRVHVGIVFAIGSNEIAECRALFSAVSALWVRSG